MSSNLYETVIQTRKITNPANLRWHYAIESVMQEEIKAGNNKLIEQLRECFESLAKFPLVLEDVTHCAILHGFNANIITRMKTKVHYSSETSEDDTPWKPLRNLENWNLSPIAKRQELGMLERLSYVLYVTPLPRI